MVSCVVVLPGGVSSSSGSDRCKKLTSSTIVSWLAVHKWVCVCVSKEGNVGSVGIVGYG